MRYQRRYLGLELAGAKNQKTAMAAIEYYPKEHKIFLLDIYDRISGHDQQSGDEAFLEVLKEIRDGAVRMGVNVPLELPPCTTCTRKTCPLPQKCTVPSVRWMREITRKAMRAGSKSGKRVLDFTPYTQRPIELWVRYEALPHLQEFSRFEIDEALGGNKAPLTARMNFLKRHLKDIELVEVWPKLTISVLSKSLGAHKRLISGYRHLEEGAHARGEILELLCKEHGIFIYERDLRKLSHSLTAFDAFVCAYTALLSDTGQCAKIPSGFPPRSGWVQHPRPRD